MSRIRCPRCGGRGLRIIWGLPADPTALWDDEEVVLGGCCIEPGISHECGDCRHRWGDLDREAFEPLRWLESTCGVSFDRLVERLVVRLDYRFVPTRPTQPVECPDHASVFNNEQVVLGTPGLVVLSRYDHGVVEVAEYATLSIAPGWYVPVRVRPAKLFDDDHRNPEERADHLARVIKEASRRRRATFRTCRSCRQKLPPELFFNRGRCIECATDKDR